MKVSLNQTTSPNVRDTNGYGYAGNMCKKSLEALGHEVSWRDATADVEINFIQPENWHWSGAPYRIAYLPWESTDIRPGWSDSLNECDEVWTPSPVIAEWLREQGVTKDVRVYEHGVEPVWSKVKRPSTGTFEVMHQGAEALRKGGNEVIQAFMGTLWDHDARLTMKMRLDGFALHDTEHIRIRRNRESIEDLVALYHEESLLCYPSWGEGFGLVPLQAMATGMPVLITKGWAPYERFLPDNCLISSELVESPWQDHHPGRMFKPDDEEMREKLLWHYQPENREMMSEWAYEVADHVSREYDWERLTRQAFAHLV